MLIYIIEYNGNILGIYNDYNNLTNLINGLKQNNLMNISNINILEYSINSIYCIKKYNYLDESKKEILPLNNNNLDITDPNVIKKLNEKIEIQHNINILNLKKEKAKELKQIYDNDIKLYEIFKKEIDNNENFIIPELFQIKYKIFNLLEKENKLSFENFIKEQNNNETDIELFKPNEYENKFINEKNIINNEEFEIDSED